MKIVKWAKLLILMLILALSVAACNTTSNVTPTAEPTKETEKPTAEPTKEAEKPTAEPTKEAAMTGTGALAEAMAGKYKGTVVTMDGPFTDVDAVKFEDTIKGFEEATGIDIQYEGSKEFEASISVKVDGNNAPDIADFPQPGLLAGFVKDGKVVDVSTFLDDEYMQGQYLQSWLDMAMMEAPDGPIMAGVWQRFNGKSQVWYPKAAFDEAGYTIPTTWEEMTALMDLIVEDGDTPWCIGIESGAATGWAATDWMEEIMLRTTSLENYDKWTRGELKFDSPEVRKAVEVLSDIWFNDEYVFGGRQAIATTSFGDSPLPMFEAQPKCWLHKQGNFITSFFPETAKAGVDYDFFYLPPIDAAQGKPYLVAGDIIGMFNDRPEVRAVVEYFTKGESMKGWLTAGGTLAPQKDVQLDWYGNDVERAVAAAVQQATSVRFDGSDLMPGEVGAGTFWKGMTDYVVGTSELDTILKEIDASWPTSMGTESEPTKEAAMTGTGALAEAMAGKYKGTVVTMDGPFTDVDAVKFEDTIKGFEEATGIDIQYEGSKEFEASISVKVDGNNAPDIADFPQPGLLAGFVKDGKVVDVSTFLDDEYMQGQYLQSWLDMAMMEAPDGPIMAGVWQRFNGKSQVWYPKAAFDEAGYTIPTTWEEMTALMDLIVEDGDTPWCIGIESGAATGWAATDWMEEIMLRTTSLENYDKWTRGELKFDSPEVRKAVEVLSDIWFNDEYVFGGRQAIATTSFGDSPLPMFEAQPKCWLHKQGNFITSFFPETAKAGVDYDFFYLPPIDAAQGKPYLVAGDIIGMFNDRPEVRAVVEYFTKGESMKGWLTAGGTLAPQKDVQLDWYGNDVERAVAAAVQQATSVRFDGSDLMPGEVGAGTFWKGMTDYVVGTSELDTILKEIDASWPTKK